MSFISNILQWREKYQHLLVRVFGVMNLVMVFFSFIVLIIGI